MEFPKVASMAKCLCVLSYRFAAIENRDDMVER